ncbi:hypothetical protein IV500_04505 [Paeniglutamicibacter antarcticus]|uniref:Uncharacterized protein n=1 Tax=Arthrobacter terrae TaxID=2935737 RepID=A0A931CHI0_9MICC|nr:hypothetical protein [Arthrobacter terrae]MBG0738682.1 hypothetical protein [Arthrobacter terrae]
MNKNMYLVNKETGLIHVYFKQDPRLMANDPVSAPCYLSGNVYMADGLGLTLDRLRELDFSGESEYDYSEGTSLNEFSGDSTPFLFIQHVHYASYKGYRIIRFADGIQVYDDFSSSDMLEVQAFIGLLFERHLGLDEIKKWDDVAWDKYGLLARVAEDFTIEGDDDELIFDSESFTNRPQLETPSSERFEEKRARDAEESARQAAR